MGYNADIQPQDVMDFINALQNDALLADLHRMRVHYHGLIPLRYVCSDGTIVYQEPTKIVRENLEKIDAMIDSRQKQLATHYRIDISILTQ